MKKLLLIACLIAGAIINTAAADVLPSYYPTEGFDHTGRIDAVYVNENRIIIGDISYQMSDSPVVHSLSSYRDSFTRIRKIAHVAFRLGQGRVIVEFWLLPSNYER